MPDEMENRSEADVLQYLNDDGIHPNYWTGTTHLSGFEWERVAELPIEQIQGRVDLHRTYKESGYGNDLERYEKMLIEAQHKGNQNS